MARRLAAIMFTDIAGYTALSQRDEPAALRLLQDQERLVRGLLEVHRGRLVKSIGDGLLMEFANALDAVQCAVDLQRHIQERNTRGPSPELRVRIGIHLGDVEGAGSDILGDAVNIASRVEPLAEPGGVCLSESVYVQVRNKVSFPLEKLGPKTLKGVREPVDVYRVRLAGQPWDVEPVAPLDSRRIVVLPFASISPDPNDEYFADGLTEELITRLSRVNGLEVIARTSAMNYKRKEKNAAQIGTELKVGTLLEGSVRKAGTRIRVSAQLIDVKTEGHLWAESYDRDLKDIFEIQDSVSESVAGALKVRILGAEREGVESTNSVEAYTMYLRATHLTNERWGEANCREAIKLLEGALSLDPGFARAYVGLATAWMQMANWADYTVSVKRAEAAVRKALELRPESAEAHLAMAQVHGCFDRFGEQALELENAMRINPNLAEANARLGERYGSEGRFDQAIEFFRKARSIDPLHSELAMEFAMWLRVAGRLDDALDVVEKLKEVHRGEDWLYVQPALCYLQRKDFAKALEVLDAGLRSCPDEQWLRLLRGVIYAVSGRRKEAMQELQDLMNDQVESHRLRAQVWIGTALRDFDLVFPALMRQAEVHSWISTMPFEPFFEELRKDPRFSEFCKKVGIPASAPVLD